jgi:hypothetical protein
MPVYKTEDFKLGHYRRGGTDFGIVKICRLWPKGLLPQSARRDLEKFRTTILPDVLESLELIREVVSGVALLQSASWNILRKLTAGSRSPL